jgi:peptidyl-prolyl cis-trans isomerase D
MSIIQDIRDKYAKVTVVLIALALVGFILTDYFQSKGRSAGGSTSNSIGSVNGRNINYDEFSRNVEINKQNLKAQAQQQGYPISPALDEQASDQTWNQEIARLLLEEELNNLGITVGKKEMGDVLYGVNAPDDIKRQFTDSATGRFDAVKAKQTIDGMLKNKQTPVEQKAQFNSYINSLDLNRKSEKYVSLLANSVNQPRWYVEKQNADASQMAKISFVNETYPSIADSTIKVEDKDIADFISKHKDMFKQGESRSISFVSFSAAPSAKDSADAKKNLQALKAEFDSTDILDQFFLNQGVTNYYKGYINGKTIQIADKDSIFRTPVGSVYGPYLDGGSYVLAKIEGVRQMPDTVKVRHILISTQQGRDSTTATNLADSIKNAIAKGANFDSLCAKYSDDGNKNEGGVYDNVYSGRMVPTFNDFIFMNPAGSKGIVKTDFGYHYVEVLSQKGGGAGYKIAYLPKEIITSKETDAAALANANKFAGDIKDIKTFDTAFEKEWKAKGYNKGIAADVAPSVSEIRGVGISRAFVKMIYDANRGEVLKPELIDNNYVVAVVTDVQEEGTMGVAKARQYVEATLRNKKKAEILIKKAGKITTLEAAATVFGGKEIVTADSIRMTSSGSSKLNYEPRIMGAAFNPANKGKMVPEALEGSNGVYVVRVDNVSSTPVTNGDVASQRKAQEQQMRQSVQNPQGQGYPLNTLRSAATIKDKRSRRM